MTTAEVYEEALAKYIEAFRARYNVSFADHKIIPPGSLVTVYAGAFDQIFYPSDLVVASNDLEAP